MRRFDVHTSADCLNELFEMTKPVLDATDIALLALLRDDARAPTAVLARKLKLSRTSESR